MEANFNFHTNRRLQFFLIILVIFIGVGGTALGALNVRSNILDPYKYRGEDGPIVQNTLGNNVNSAVLDTDQDGLTDSDELNVYGTSPYLADSDSDGISDFDELENGTNPNCPVGQLCGEQAEASTNQPVANAPQPQDSQDIELVPGLEAGIEQLRAMLVAGGLSEAEVSAIGDEDILKAYQQASAGITVNTDSSDEIDKLKNLSADEIRTLMSQQGIDESLLNNIPDEELVELYLKSFESVR